MADLPVVLLKNGRNPIAVLRFLMPDRLQAERAVDGLVLHLPMRFDYDANEQGAVATALTNLTAFVTIGSVLVGTATAPERFIGPVYNGDARLLLPLSARAIAHIERVRNGRAVDFHLRVHGHLSLDPSAPRYVATTTSLPDAGQLGVILADRGDYCIPVETWVRVLREYGYGRNVLVEIRLPPPPADTKWAPVWQHLENAYAQYESGHGVAQWKSVVVECRGALEEWNNIEKAKSQNELGTPKQQWTTEERLGVLRWSLLQVAHEPAHTHADLWIRDHATAVLSTLANLLALRNP